MSDDEINHDIGRIACEIAEAGRQAQKYRLIDWWRPYPRQMEFFALKQREAALMGSQLGKSDACAFATAAHLTGQYPNGGPAADMPTRMTDGACPRR